MTNTRIELIERKSTTESREDELYGRLLRCPVDIKEEKALLFYRNASMQPTVA